MLQKLRTVVYHVNDLTIAKKWFSDVFNIQPYFDEPFYVGYDIGGSELGLDPSPEGYSAGNQSISYWLVSDLKQSFEELKAKKVQIHQEVNEVGGGILTASIADPFGNIIGLIEIPSDGH